MGSEQSVPPKKQAQRPPPVRRGHTIAASNIPASCKSESSATGYDSPGASMCSDSELPYISYTNRPIGDSPKHTSKQRRGAAEPKRPPLQRAQTVKPRRAHDIVVVKPATDSLLDEDLRRLQEIPTFLPIMRGTLGLPGARDPEILEGLDSRPWVRLAARLQAHLSACAQPIASDQAAITGKTRQFDVEINRLYSQMVDKQRNNARQAERLARVTEVAHQLSRCNSLLNQTLQDVTELNALLPADKRLEPFIWNEAKTPS